MNTNAINFLLYSYFGITLDSKEEEIIPAAINRAYRDASSHVLSIKDHKEKEDCKKRAISIIQGKIKELSKDTDYNQWHGDLCQELEDKYKGCGFTKDKNGATREFSYGIAQKWVNMTMKYLYVLETIFVDYKNQENGFLLPIAPQKLHVPVDSYIMQAAQNKNVLLPRKDKEKTLGSISSAKPWSKWNKDEYIAFQKRLQEKLKQEPSPIDWEGSAWIEVAKTRNTK